MELTERECHRLRAIPRKEYMKCIRESTLRTSDLVARYVWHTLRALSEEVMNFFNRVEPRIYFVSSDRGEVFYLYEDSFIEIKNVLRNPHKTKV